MRKPLLCWITIKKFFFLFLLKRRTFLVSQLAAKEDTDYPVKVEPLSRDAGFAGLVMQMY